MRTRSEPLSGLTTEAIQAAAGVSYTYAHNIVRGHRAPGEDVALRIWRATGHKLGRLHGATDEDIEALARTLGVAA